MASLHLDSIRGKILLLALLATLVPTLSTAALTYARTRAALTETLEGELGGIGYQTAREMDLWTRERFYDLRVLAGSFEVVENLERVDGGGPGAAEAAARLGEHLTVVQDRLAEYASLVVLDDDGQAVANGASEVAPPEVPMSWLVDLERGRTRLASPYWHEGLSSVAATLAVPVESRDGRFLGSLGATLTFAPVSELLAGPAARDRGSVQLLSADGGVMADSEGTVGGEDGDGLRPPLPAEALERLASADGTAEYRTEDGTPMVGLLTEVEPLGWRVLTQLPASDAYAPVARLTRSTLLLVAFLFVVVGGAAYAIGLYVTRPLARLADAAGAVAEGDLTVDLPVSGRDEVSDLTEVFNGMVTRLRANAEELDESHTALRSQNEELERLSNTDTLTSLYNRRYVAALLEKELERASRHERTLAVLMLDLDRFKRYNDAYGHQAGDDVLAGMGEVLRDATRGADVPARYGGEEFIVILPDCDMEGALEAGERIRKRLSREVFQGGKVTVSIGASAYPLHGASATELVAAADRALYAAKAAGRDRVVAASTDAA